MKLITELPAWFILFCLLLAALYTAILYFRDKRSGLKPKLKRWLVPLRFLSVAAISFLLLSPLVRSQTRTVEKPVIIFAQDNSESLVLGKDSAFYKNDYKEALDAFLDKTGNAFELRSYHFGAGLEENTETNYSAKETDMSILFDEMEARFTNRNVGALIIATDGLYNRGTNPLYSAEALPYPLYTIALGDTSLQKDFVISKVNANRIAFKGNDFPLEIVLRASKLSGKKALIKIAHKGKVVHSEEVNIKGENWSGTFPVFLKAEHVGMQRYSVSITSFEEEISTKNNYNDFFVDVMDSRQKILLLAAYPHPDISAIRYAIESNYNYEAEVALASKFTGNLAAYDLVIMHQLPNKQFPGKNVIDACNNKKIPILYIIGAKTDLIAFNNLKTGLQIVGKTANMNDSRPFFKKEFPLFSLSEKSKSVLSEMPPLNCPFGDYKMSNASHALINQKIKNVESGIPMLSFNQDLTSRGGVLAGEGIWRWRMANYALKDNQDAFNEFISKTVQYLAVRADKSFFRVFWQKDFRENQTVEFDAELYNDSYELTNEPEVKLQITDEEENQYPFVFGRTSNAYHLNAGVFPVGNYTFKAGVKLGSKVYEESGSFSVSPINIESVNLVADHRLLYNMAAKHGGDMFFPSQFDQLFAALDEREDITSVSYTQQRFNELISLPWLLGLLIFLLSIEWFLRKRGGAY